DGAVVDGEKLLFELDVARIELPRAQVLRMVAPVAVGADPDLEQRRLVLGDRAIARCGERLDAGARPDERVAARVLDSPLETGAYRVYGTLPRRSGLCLGHPGMQPFPNAFGRERGKLVCEPHALDLLPGLDCAGLGEGRAPVDAVRESLEERGRGCRRLAEHAVGRLRPLAQLEADTLEAALTAHLLR